jgi:hypothetical protein
MDTYLFVIHFWSVTETTPVQVFAFRLHFNCSAYDSKEDYQFLSSGPIFFDGNLLGGDIIMDSQQYAFHELALGQVRVDRTRAKLTHETDLETELILRQVSTKNHLDL